MKPDSARQPGRWPTIADLLVLVAACALGLVGVRFAVSLDLHGPELTRIRRITGAWLLVERLSVYGAPILVAMTMAVLVLGLVHSQAPRLWRLGRRPGYVSCVGAAVAILYVLTFYAILMIGKPQICNVVM